MLSNIGYYLKKVVENYDDRRWWRGVLTYKLASPVLQRMYDGNGTYVMAEEWDNLIVLDACRADLFESIIDVSQFDSYRRVQSVGSSSYDWTEKNFADRKYSDTMYVTANPHTNKLASNSFHKLISPWKYEFDDNVGTVTAETINNETLEHFEQDKRLIAHYMQPHHPFLNESGSLIEHDDGWDPNMLNENKNANEDRERPWTVWQAVEMGMVSYEEAWSAYQKNLEYVFKNVMELVNELPGKSVITSDHGNLIGERLWPVPVKGYGHPKGVPHPILTTVPWAEIDGESRDHIEGTVDRDTISPEDSLNEKLSALGYKE